MADSTSSQIEISNTHYISLKTDNDIFQEVVMYRPVFHPEEFAMMGLVVPMEDSGLVLGFPIFVCLLGFLGLLIRE